MNEQQVLWLNYGNVTAMQVVAGIDGGIHLHVYDNGADESLITAILSSEEAGQLIKELRLAQQVITVQPPLPLPDPVDLEARLGALVEAYVWEAAHLDEHMRNEPKPPNQPLYATVAEWNDFQRARGKFEAVMTEWGDQHLVLLARLESLTNTMGDLMPDSFNLLIPAFGELYTIWATHAWADIANGDQKYRMEVRPYRPNEKEETAPFYAESRD